MARTQDEVKACEVCGASIYPEHIKKGVADFLAGKLLCPHCLQEKKLLATVNPAALYKDDTEDQTSDEPITLADEEEDDMLSGSSTQIQAFGDSRVSGATSFGAPLPEREYRRPLLKNSPNATRCRIFHSKLNDQSFANMNETINEWVDANDDIQIKFVSSCVGTIEAKSSQDMHLIVTVFY